MSRVMLITDDLQRGEEISAALGGAGYAVVARVQADADLEPAFAGADPDLIVVSIAAADRITLEQVRSIGIENPTPVVIFTQRSDNDMIQAAIDAGVSAFVVDGFDPARLQPIIEVAIARFRERRSLQDELARTRSKLADRKTIDRAKGILMKQRKCSEDEAYHTLRKMAMKQNIQIVEVATKVISLEELLA